MYNQSLETYIYVNTIHNENLTPLRESLIDEILFEKAFLINENEDLVTPEVYKLNKDFLFSQGESVLEYITEKVEFSRNTIFTSKQINLITELLASYGSYKNFELMTNLLDVLLYDTSSQENDNKSALILTLGRVGALFPELTYARDIISNYLLDRLIHLSLTPKVQVPLLYALEKIGIGISDIRIQNFMFLHPNISEEFTVKKENINQLDLLLSKLQTFSKTSNPHYKELLKVQPLAESLEKIPQKNTFLTQAFDSIHDMFSTQCEETVLDLYTLFLHNEIYASNAPSINQLIQSSLVFINAYNRHETYCRKSAPPSLRTIGLEFENDHKVFTEEKMLLLRNLGFSTNIESNNLNEVKSHFSYSQLTQRRFIDELIRFGILDMIDNQHAKIESRNTLHANASIEIPFRLESIDGLSEIATFFGFAYSNIYRIMARNLGKIPVKLERDLEDSFPISRNGNFRRVELNTPHISDKVLLKMLLTDYQRVMTALNSHLYLKNHQSTNEIDIRLNQIWNALLETQHQSLNGFTINTQNKSYLFLADGSIQVDGTTISEESIIQLDKYAVIEMLANTSLNYAHKARVMLQVATLAINHVIPYMGLHHRRSTKVEKRGSHTIIHYI